jgi:Leucine-rich repeat (LRR) protein
MNLTSLNLRQGNVGDADVKNLAGMKDLQVLSLWGTKVTDVGLKELAGLKNLQQLSLQGTGVTDVGLKELAGLDRLVFLDLYGVPGVTDAGLEKLAGLKALKTLELRATRVTDAGARKLAAVMPSLGIVISGRGGGPRFVFGPFPDADVQRIAALPAAVQVEEVRQELMRRNKGFDGALKHQIEGDVVTELSLEGPTCDQVTDLSPVRALVGLKSLGGRLPQLSDLSPLKEMKLTELSLEARQVKDLSPLKGMPLKTLSVYATGVTDLTPLQGMPLEEIRLTPKNITKGVDILRKLNSLKTVGTDAHQSWPAAEFWARYDKGEFKE